MIKNLFYEISVRYGFSLIDHMYEPDRFGNLSITTRKGDLSVSYSRDRGDESLYFVVGSEPYALVDVREVLFGTKSSSMTLNEEVDFLETSLGILCGHFESTKRNEYVDALNQLRKRRLHAMFPGAVGEPKGVSDGLKLGEEKRCQGAPA